ncbi:MAG: UvrD-helicase domain-containing protein [Solirubrobacteraceae bacterium]|nr:UvrD-helicase domain-containing protein [Solirubrobacteraceae bacterium]
MSAASPLTGPGGRELTAEQALAVGERDGPLILAANAGSGKTTVLVERFVRHVTEDGLDPRSILAITFTRRAAGELRRRVRERLMELGRTEDARALEGAWISTIDGFCARLLQGHAVLAGVDPGFRVLEAAELRALRERAWERAATEVLGAEGSGGAAEQLLTVAGWDELRGVVATVHEERRSAGEARPRLPLPPEPDVAREGRRLVAAAQVLAAELGASERLGRLKTIQAAHAAAERVLAEVGPDPARVLGPGAAARLSCTFRANVPELQSPACAAFQDAHAGYAQACVDHRARPALLALDALLAAYGEAFAAEKRAAGGLDFPDLALGARDLLRARPELAAAYRERLPRVMVDEFQDTNRLQLDLLEALGTGQLFAVGDLLQSIYGFRHADVRVFAEVWDRLAAEGRARELATSFRARPELLTVINGAWAGVHERYVPLRAGRRDTAAPAPCAELLLVDAPAWEALEDGDPALAALADGLPAAPRAVQAEARAVARRVAALIAPRGPWRPGDVVILLRSGTHMAVYERALERERVPGVATQGRGWWTRREVQDLLCHLRVLVNPFDEPALLGALAAPFAALRADALALLAEERRARGAGLWEVVRAAGAGDRGGLLARLPAADTARLGTYAELVAAEREAAARLGPGELLERVVRATGYDAAVLRGPGGARRVANARKLVALAHAFERRAGRELRAFADFAAAELQADEPTPDAPIDLGDAQAVRLMTVHGAKGLEFPVVVVADLGRAPGGNGPDVLVRGGRVGLRVPGLGGAKDRAFAYAELEDERREAEAAEERRVMHVAVTRAEEHLILSGSWNPEKGWPGAGHRAPALAWLGPGLWDAAGEAPASLTVRDGAATAEVAVTVDRPGTPGAEAETEAEGPGPAPAPGPSGPAPAAPGAPGALPTPEPAAVPATLSYSSLSDYRACPYSWYLRRVLRLPRRDASDLAQLVPPGRRDDALVRGTIAHLVLEHADLRAAGAPSPEAIRAAAALAGAELDEDQLADQAQLAAGFLDSPLRARVAACPDVRREAPFAYPLAGPGADGPIVQGVIDLIARDGEDALVIDYKTDRLGPDEDPEELVRRDYPIQRALYALAALRAGARRAEVVHLFLARPQDPASAVFTAADLPQLEARLREAAGGLLHGVFPVAAEPHAGLCATCPGRGGLCSWPAERTGRPVPGQPS